MRKLLIPLLCAATQVTGGCSADHIPFVYRLEVRSGEVSKARIHKNREIMERVAQLVVS